MIKQDVQNPEQALVYLTDCTLATVLDLASKARPPKNELLRQMEIAQSGINWMDRFGISYSGTRAEDVKKHGGTVQRWVMKNQ